MHDVDGVNGDDGNDSGVAKIMRHGTLVYMAFPPAEPAKEVGNEVLTHRREAGPELGCHVSC